jgi:uncharacterized membrane protein YdfJ with MMPL/SSD domain
MKITSITEERVRQRSRSAETDMKGPLRWVLAATLAATFGAAAADLPADGVKRSPGEAAAQNATVSSTKASRDAATQSVPGGTTAAADEPRSDAATPAAPRKKLLMRLDDGRYSGFHQDGEGVDEPVVTGERDASVTNRVHAETDRIRQENRAARQDNGTVR